MVTVEITLFAWTQPLREASEPGAPGSLGSVEALDRKRVTQCALSRICGYCSRPLGRPIAFLGIEAEVERNSFYAPPLHTECAEALLDRPDSDQEWSIVTTSGFEYIRPERGQLERYPTFVPNSLL